MILKTIVEFPNYKISENGRIFKRNKLLLRQVISE